MHKTVVLILGFLCMWAPSCRNPDSGPLAIDQAQGMIFLDPQPGMSLRFNTWVNDTNMIRNAHLFSKKEKVTLINSMGMLDEILELSPTGSGYALTLSLVNAGDEKRYIREVLLMKEARIPPNSRLHVWEQTAQISFPGKDSGGFCLQTKADSLWKVSFWAQKDSLSCGLDLSPAPLSLPPGERITFPQVRIFFHLCPVVHDP